VTGYLDDRTPFDAGRLVDIGGIEVWCHESGDGEPLLLLGGPSVGHFHFDFVRPHLRGYRLLTWEPRGFGPSGRDGPYSVEVWAADLERLLDALFIDRAHVWANAFSSYIGFAFAAAHPGRIGGLVAYTDVWAGDPVKSYAGAWDAYREIIAAHGTSGEGAARLAQLYALTQPPWFADWFELSAGEVLHAENAAETIGYFCTEADVRDRLADVRAPVLLLVGDRSWDGTPLDTSIDPSLEAIRERIPQARVETLHAHPVHLILQEPERAAAIVQEFLRMHSLG
jgi:pimeloyl-ACP methyl ester carboxylesterase